MRRYAGILTVLMVVVLLVAGTAQAQGGALVAFVNNSGQLVVSSGDGATRWIVTNPGETLAEPLGFTWSPGGRQVFFAVNAGDVSLRVGDVGSQSVAEIGRASGVLTGGDWSPDGGGVYIGANNQVNFYPVNGGGPITVATGQGNVALVSPYANDRPNEPAGHSISNDGQFLFFWDGSQGRYFTQAVNGGTPTALPGTNDPNARSNGLWSEAGPLVAYWGFEGGVSVLSVTNAANGQTVTLNSGRSAPIAPVGWRPGTTQLVYRDQTSFVRIADMGCLNGGCGSNPLETGVELLPATASEIIAGRDWVYYRDGEQILAVNLGCASSGNCAGSTALLGANAAPQTVLDVGGNTLSYTAYTQDARNPGDREVRAISLGCLPSCQPQPVAFGAVAGLVSSDGGYVTADAGGNGLNTVNLFNGSATNLSGAGANLLKARWS